MELSMAGVWMMTVLMEIDVGAYLLQVRFSSPFNDVVLLLGIYRSGRALPCEDVMSW
jgi:hypothetical protein